MPKINQQRDALQANVREREQAIETGRQQVLRLLGEASTLRNQLAQIDEYLAGIERETARARQRRSRRAPAEIERAGNRPQSSFPRRMPQRQLELESVTGERRRTEEELAERRAREPSKLRREIDALQDELSQIQRAQGIARSRCCRTAPTPPNR